MKTWICTAAVLAATTSCGSPAKKKLTLQEMIAADPLPLAKGAKWSYNVTLTKFDVATNKEITSTMQWTTEVIDAKEQNGVTAYRVKGWPTDLADATEGTPVASERTILRSGNNIMFGGPNDWAGEPSLDGAEGWFSWPVIDGQEICPSAEMVYCWQVSAVDSGYRLTFYTGPDEQAFDIEPATGIARFYYAHHGTTNEVEAVLSEYSAPKR